MPSSVNSTVAMPVSRSSDAAVIRHLGRHDAGKVEFQIAQRLVGLLADGTLMNSFMARSSASFCFPAQSSSRILPQRLVRAVDARSRAARRSRRCSR